MSARSSSRWGAAPDPERLEHLARCKAKAQSIARKMASKIAAYDDLTSDGNASLKRLRTEDILDFDYGGPRQRKIYIPVQHYPDVNFPALFSGTTHKTIESKSSARITLCGKGCGREGEEIEELHVLITADSEDAIVAGSDLVQEVLITEHKLNAKRQLIKRHQEMGGAPVEAMFPASLYSEEAASEAPPKTKEIFIPNEKVGLVIGRGGETIKMLQSQTGCHIQIARETEPPTATRLVTLGGTAQEIADAEAEIRRIIDGQLRGIRPVGMAGEVVKIVKIPNTMVGLLIGKGGETIRQLQQRTGAHIQVTRDSEANPQSGFREVTLAGTQDQLTEVMQEIQGLIQANPQANPTGFNIMTSDPEQLVGDTVVIRVPNSTVGVIIGKGGETIKNLQLKTGARIQIAKDEKLPDREITLSGGGPEIEMARQEIYQLVSQGRLGGDANPFTPAAAAAAGNFGFDAFGFDPTYYGMDYATYFGSSSTDPKKQRPRAPPPPPEAGKDGANPPEPPSADGQPKPPPPPEKTPEQKAAEKETKKKAKEKAEREEQERQSQEKEDGEKEDDDDGEDDERERGESGGTNKKPRTRGRGKKKKAMLQQQLVEAQQRQLLIAAAAAAAKASGFQEPSTAIAPKPTASNRKANNTSSNASSTFKKEVKTEDIGEGVPGEQDPSGSAAASSASDAVSAAEKAGAGAGAMAAAQMAAMAAAGFNPAAMPAGMDPSMYYYYYSMYGGMPGMGMPGTGAAGGTSAATSTDPMAAMMQANMFFPGMGMGGFPPFAMGPQMAVAVAAASSSSSSSSTSEGNSSESDKGTVGESNPNGDSTQNDSTQQSGEDNAGEGI